MAFFDKDLLFFIAIASSVLKCWKHAFIISLSTAVEDSYDEAVVYFTQRTESCLQVVKRDLFLRVRQDNLAHVVHHHSMSSVVQYCQCLFVGFCIVGDSSLARGKGLFDGGHA